MDPKKQADFVKRMGKKRLSLVKGGMVKRKNMDLGGQLGLSGGAGGTGFSTNPGTNGQQLNTAYNQNQDALTYQTSLSHQLAPQVTTGVNAQNVLSGQFANQAVGSGPNVAQTMLNQTTGQNVANEAALMAGQRGAGSNVGLLAREAAQTGAGIQQNAAGQAASLQAQQQIAAEQAQAQLAANQIAQSQGATSAATQAQQGEQGILQNANTANNNVQGQLANTSLQGQQGLVSGALKGVGGATGLFAEGGEVGEHHAKKLDFVHKMTKLGLEHHGKPMMAEGGAVPATSPHQNSWSDYFGSSKAQGSDTSPVQQNNQDSVETLGARHQVSDSFKNAFADGGVAEDEEMHPQFQGPHKSHIANYLMNTGGKVPAMVSPGEVYLSPEQVHKVIHEDVDPEKIGMKFKGKAKVKGDSKKNDFIPADLEQGGVVIDRENMSSPEKRKLFVHKTIAKHKAGRK